MPTRSLILTLLLVLSSTLLYSQEGDNDVRLRRIVMEFGQADVEIPYTGYWAKPGLRWHGMCCNIPILRLRLSILLGKELEIPKDVIYVYIFLKITAVIFLSSRLDNPLNRSGTLFRKT